MAVKAIPEGHSTIVPFFNIKGAADAIALYKKAFGAEETYRQDNNEGKVAICELRIGTGFVRISDAVKDAPTQSSTHLLVENVDAWWKRATDAGLEVVQQLDTKFYGERSGILRDPIGNRWLLTQHVEDVSPEEVRRRAMSRS